jgi:hypothetical protein
VYDPLHRGGVVVPLCMCMCMYMRTFVRLRVMLLRFISNTMYAWARVKRTQAAWRLDQLLTLANDVGIYTMLSLHTFNYFRTEVRVCVIPHVLPCVLLAPAVVHDPRGLCVGCGATVVLWPPQNYYACWPGCNPYSQIISDPVDFFPDAVRGSTRCVCVCVCVGGGGV